MEEKSFEGLARTLLSQIDGQAVVDLATKLGNIASPKGQEREVGEFIYQWLVDNDFPATRQEVVPDRFNVVGLLPGSGSGRSLIFNSHMDTSNWRPEDRWLVGEEQPHHNRAWVADGKVYGEGVVNDKGPMAAFLIAASALKQSKIKLAGDIRLTMVVGEIGQAPVDEFQGSKYLGKGIGTKHLVEHGVWADFALVAETTSFGMTWAEAGCAFFKITVFGHRVYTPYLIRPGKLAEHPNPIVKMAKIVEAIEEYAIQYEKKNSYQFDAGTIIPKISVGAIRAGHPYAPISVPGLASIYLDARIPPTGNPMTVKRELEDLIAKLGFQAKIEMYLYRKGYVGKGIEPLRDAITKAHRYVLNGAPGQVASPVTSMWRDINVFNAVGIPAITYGPGAASGRLLAGAPYLEVDELINAARIYALTALYLCNQSQR